MINIKNLIKKKIKYLFHSDEIYYWNNYNGFKINTSNLINREFINWSLKQPYSNNLDKKIFIYEKYQSLIFEKYIKKAKIFIDLGCQIGFYSLLANQHTNIEEIYLVDISKSCIEASRYNMDNNYSSNKKIKIINDALGTGNVTYNHWADKSRVKGKNIYELLKLNKQTKISNEDIIKIDIEGHEYTYNETIKEFLKKNKPTLFFSLHKDFINKLSGNQSIYEEIIKDLLKTYKKLFYLNDHSEFFYEIKSSIDIPREDINPVLVCTNINV